MGVRVDRWPREAVAAAMLVTGSCGKHDDAVDRDLIAELATELCDAREPCGCPASLDDCESDERARLTDVFDEAADRGLRPDRECIEELLRSLRTIECRSFSDFEIDEWYDFFDGNRCATFVGDGREGDPCRPLGSTHGQDCVQGLECDGGLCVPPVAIPGPGGECDHPTDACREDSTCVTDPASPSLHCERNAYEGEPCIGTEQLCAAGFACIGGSCTVARDLGEPCFVADAAWNRCRLGLICVDGYCDSGRELGEACSPTTCRPGLSCDSELEICREDAAMVCYDPMFP